MSWRLKKGVQHNDSVSTHIVIITKSVKVWKNGISKEWFFFLFDLEKLTQSIFLHSSVEALNWTLTQLDCLFYILTDTDTHIVKSQLQTKTEIHCVVGLLCTFMWQHAAFLHLFFFFSYQQCSSQKHTCLSFNILGKACVFSSLAIIWFGFSTVAMERKTVRGANWSYSNFTKLSDKTGSF